MDSRQKFEYWLDNGYFDAGTREELEEIKDKPMEIEERFYKDLEFGTAGMRGLIGAGTNRMNIYTVRKATQGVAGYIKKSCKENRCAVIAYDCRRMSSEFAMECAKVLAGNGIKAFIFSELRPVPELSFAVRHLKAAAGIMITASHNPKEYNGYKVYGSDGAQLSLEDSQAVINEIDALEDITAVSFIGEAEGKERGLIQVIGNEVDDEYISRLKTLSINSHIAASGKEMKIVYTPLHGTGNKPVRRILKETGFSNVIVVKEQELPDGEFPTVKFPNPEYKEAFEMAIKLASRENADLIIGTDPDCDRVGVVVKNSEGEYVVLTGNQIGCLLLEYIVSQKKEMGKLPQNCFVVKTIVTTELASKIAAGFGVEMVEVLTGFKFIGEKIRIMDEYGDKKFIFGFEESYGYLAGTFSRDKDGVVTSMLIAEMAAFYRSRNMSLYDGLQEIYQKYGYALEGAKSFTLKGKEGLAKIKEIMAGMRRERPRAFGEFKISAIRDYMTGERVKLDSNGVSRLDLPQSDVLYYEIEGGSWVCIRPSGTEPQIKLYFGVNAADKAKAQEKLEALKARVLEHINAYVS